MCSEQQHQERQWFRSDNKSNIKIISQPKICILRSLVQHIHVPTILGFLPAISPLSHSSGIFHGG